MTHLSPLLQRIITAIILIPLVIWGIFSLSPLWFAILSAIIFLFAGYEWTSLMGLQAKWAQILYLGILVLLFLLCYQSLVTATSKPHWLIFLFIIFALWWTFAFAFIVNYAKTRRTLISHPILYGLLGVLVLIPCWLSLCLLRQIPLGPFYILFVLLLVWAADTGAYFTGRLFGKRKLIPAVSPGKTWAGLYGGLSLAMLVAFITMFFLKIPITKMPMWLIWSFIVVLYSIVGDLFVSVMKRQRNLKDTGQLLPGHGGILDRIDSLTAALPIFTLGIFYLGIL